MAGKGGDGMKTGVSGNLHAQRGLPAPVLECLWPDLKHSQIEWSEGKMVDTNIGNGSYEKDSFLGLLMHTLSNMLLMPCF
jgi:hypothetical protein